MNTTDARRCDVCESLVGDGDYGVDIIGIGRDKLGKGRDEDIRGVTLTVCKKCFVCLTDQDMSVLIFRWGIREVERRSSRGKVVSGSEIEAVSI